MDAMVSRPEGLVCPPGDFRIDPSPAVPRAVSPRAHVRCARKCPAWRHQRQLISLVMALLVAAGGNLVRAEEVTVNSATALRAKYAELSGKLEDNAFQKALYLESSATPCVTTSPSKPTAARCPWRLRPNWRNDWRTDTPLSNFIRASFMKSGSRTT